MGIPTFFLSILQNKYYKNVHSGVKNGKLECDYFFLDYNGIVYKAFERIKKDISGKNLSKDKLEELLIDEVIRYTKYLICDVVKPNKLTYIALDGPAPRAKMVQQRSRRYKGYYEKIFLENERKKYVMDKGVDWDRSANISPGTEFMEKLSVRIQEVMKAKGFNSHNPSMKIIFDNSNCPGEGEHKFLPLVREMRKKKGINNAKVYFYGSDADLIVLGLATHKNNIHVLREVEETFEMKKMYESYEFLILNIDNLGNAFNHDLTKVFKDQQFDKLRILNDYIFLTFLVGNDFVLSLPFLKIKNRDFGLPMLISIYQELKKKHHNYLVNYHPDESTAPTINMSFFKEFVFEIGKREDLAMKEQQKEINKYMKGYRRSTDYEKESQQTPFEIFQTRFTHLPVCSPDHPLHKEYASDFLKIDYGQDYDVWKEQYYNFYLNINKKNEEEYEEVRNEIVKNYLESLMFTLNYYFKGVPSWRWFYRYRISPLLSDVYHVLNESLFDMNNINFELGKPYSPFQQLMLIFPQQMDHLVPKVLRPIMNDDKLLCTQFYPVSFRLDIAVGIKTIYSEAILPEIDEEILIPVIEKYEEKMSESEKKRNTIREKPYGSG